MNWGTIPVLADIDVLVVGSGSAGSSAAIAAARAGAQTVLIEKLPFLGGNSTAVLDTFYGFYTPGEHPKRIIGGIADEVVEALRSIGSVIERPNTYGAGTGVTYNSEHLKVVWETLTREAGVTVLFHCFLQDVVRNGRQFSEALVATKAGLRRILARVLVDCSGDADAIARADWGFEQAGAAEPAQTLTTTFKLVNVDPVARRTVSKDDLHRRMREAADDGYLLPRREGSDHITPIDGMTATVMTRVDSVALEQDNRLITIEDPRFLSAAEQQGRAQALEYSRFLRDRVPGYERSSLVALSTQIGIRETRRVFGDYRVTREDVLSAAQFEDQIGLCGAPIEDHHGGDGTHWEYLAEGTAVGIPLRSLIVRDADNALIAGRCFSATHVAQASIRSMAQCMAMGHAAGLLAALAVEHSGQVRDVSPHAVRAGLRAAGAIVDMP